MTLHTPLSTRLRLAHQLEHALLLHVHQRADTSARKLVYIYYHLLYMFAPAGVPASLEHVVSFVTHTLPNMPASLIGSCVHRVAYQPHTDWHTHMQSLSGIDDVTHMGVQVQQLNEEVCRMMGCEVHHEVPHCLQVTTRSWPIIVTNTINAPSEFLFVALVSVYTWS